MILTEVCSLLLKKNLSMLVSWYRNRLRNGLQAMAVLLACLTLWVSNSYAFSLDRPQVQSYIGQPLSVFIPISVGQGERLDSNSLIVARPTPAQIENIGLNPVDYISFQYQIVKIGDKTGVLVTSTEPLKESYANLIIQVTHQGKTRIKPYPILLDLPPSAPVSQRGLASLPNGVSNASNSSNNQSSNFSSSNIITYSPEMMGAYDWAQQGAIPKKFGPVIDGQSLWRVARRINKAMGVSIDQMAWALYKANPSSFSSDSVESLQAGSILSIPQESVVRQVTEMQAVRLLAAQSTPNVNSSNDTTAAPVSVESDDSSETLPVDDEATGANAQSATEDANPEFTMSGIDSSDANQEVISTLNATVAELSEQLLVRDQRITFLEKQIEQITGIKPEDLAGNESNVVSNVASVNGEESLPDSAVIASDEEELNTTNIEEEEIATEVTDETIGLTPDQINLNGNSSTEIVSDSTTDITEVTTIDPDVTTENQSLVDVTPPDVSVAASNTSESKSFWDWKKYLMLGLLALIAIAILFRKMIMGFVSSLFPDEDEIVLNIPSVIDEQSRATAMERPFPDVVPKSAAEVPLSDDENTEEISSDEFDDDFFMADEESVDVEEMNLSDRIKQLLNEGNFTEANKTIDFAQEANMDEKYLDFCRLKIFAAEKNKPEFAKTFNRVNRRINDFHPDIQFRIAELHREMFDSESVIDFGFIEED